MYGEKVAVLQGEYPPYGNMSGAVEHDTREKDAQLPSEETIHILVVDDQIQITLLLRKQLERDGYVVSIATSGAEALEVVKREGMPDLAVLDVLMPDLDGLALADKLKSIDDIPIIFLSAFSDLQTKVRAISAYGEDYIIKPYAYRELLARIRRILLRAFAERADNPQEIVLDDFLQINFEQQFVIVGGHKITLTPSESQLLHTLYEHRGEVVTPAMLLSEIRGPEHQTKINSLHVHIRRLRLKIEPDPNQPRYILTLRGQGYLIPAPKDLE